MTELLRPASGGNILEIGAGSGYQAAVLGTIAKRVTTIERISAVAELARRNLTALHIYNVNVIIGDGTCGYPENAPYDGILITAATPKVPPPLIEQMRERGRLVAPVGSREIPELIVLEKENSRIKESLHGGVRFVPLIGQHGWDY
jgi:protein-L-isoaspartate(D-aspartate) O-methyltransferase